MCPSDSAFAINALIQTIFEFFILSSFATLGDSGQMSVRLKSTDVQAIASHAVDSFECWESNANEHNRTRFLIALAGTPGSGKSTLAPLICAAMNKLLKRDIATVIGASAACGKLPTTLSTLVSPGMDGFHLTRAQLDKMPDPKLAHARRGA